MEKIISKMLLFKTNYLLYYFLIFRRLCRRVQAGLTNIQVLLIFQKYVPLFLGDSQSYFGLFLRSIVPIVNCKNSGLGISVQPPSNFSFCKTLVISRKNIFLLSFHQDVILRKFYGTKKNLIKFMASTLFILELFFVSVKKKCRQFLFKR